VIAVVMHSPELAFRLTSRNSSDQLLRLTFSSAHSKNDVAPAASLRPALPLLIERKLAACATSAIAKMSELISLVFFATFVILLNDWTGRGRSRELRLPLAQEPAALGKSGKDSRCAAAYHGVCSERAQSPRSLREISLSITSLDG